MEWFLHWPTQPPAIAARGEHPRGGQARQVRHHGALHRGPQCCWPLLANNVSISLRPLQTWIFYPDTCSPSGKTHRVFQIANLRIPLSLFLLPGKTRISPCLRISPWNPRDTWSRSPKPPSETLNPEVLIFHLANYICQITWKIWLIILGPRSAWWNAWVFYFVHKSTPET